MPSGGGEVGGRKKKERKLLKVQSSHGFKINCLQFCLTTRSGESRRKMSRLIQSWVCETAREYSRVGEGKGWQIRPAWKQKEHCDAGGAGELGISGKDTNRGS